MDEMYLNILIVNITIIYVYLFIMYVFVIIKTISNNCIIFQHLIRYVQISFMGNICNLEII